MRTLFASIASLGLAVSLMGAEPAKESYDIKVTGMSCSSCSSKVSTALLKVDGVKAANVCHVGKVAKIEFDPAKTSKKELVAAIEKAGYKVELAKN